MNFVLGARRVARAVYIVLLATTIHQSAIAATHRVSVALDTDQQASSGCTIAHPGGAIQGIERVVTAVIDTTASTAQVTRVEEQSCTGAQLSAPVTTITGPWSAGLGNGLSGSAAIEISTTRTGLPASGSVTGYGLSNDAAGNQDRTAAFKYSFAQANEAAVTPVPLPSIASGLLVLGLLALVVGIPRSRAYVVSRAGPILVLASVSISIISPRMISASDSISARRAASRVRAARDCRRFCSSRAMSVSLAINWRF